MSYFYGWESENEHIRNYEDDLKDQYERDQYEREQLENQQPEYYIRPYKVSKINERIKNE